MAANGNDAVDKLTASVAATRLGSPDVESRLADASATAANEVGTGDEEHAVNALSWVGLVESGLEDAAVAFLLGPTPLKAKALGKRGIGQVLNVIDMVDDEVHDTVPRGLTAADAQHSMGARTYGKLQEDIEQAKAAVVAMQDGEGYVLEVEESTIRECIEKVGRKAKKVAMMKARRTADRKTSVENGEDAAKYLWREQTEWREDAMQNVVDLSVVEAAALSDFLADRR